MYVTIPIVSDISYDRIYNIYVIILYIWVRQINISHSNYLNSSCATNLKAVFHDSGCEWKAVKRRSSLLTLPHTSTDTSKNRNK